MMTLLLPKQTKKRQIIIPSWRAGVASVGETVCVGCGAMVSLNIKCSTGSKLTVTVELEKTVGELKEQLQADVGVPPAQMRLIYAGRVLKDHQTLASYNIEDGHTVHLVQGVAPPASSVTSPAPSASTSGAAPGGLPPSLASAMAGGGGNMQQQMMQNPEMMREMMSSPMMQSLMSNPELMRTIIQSNPQMQAIIAENPEIGHVLNDPAVLRQTLEAARSPELMREMMRTTDRAMSNIESHPEGFNMLREMSQASLARPRRHALLLVGRNESAHAYNTHTHTRARAHTHTHTHTHTRLTLSHVAMQVECTTTCRNR